MVKFLSNTGTQTVVEIGGAALTCFGLGALAWSADYQPIGVALFVIGGILLAVTVAGVGLLLFNREDGATTHAPPRAPGVNALADHGSNALAAGRDMRIGTFNAAPLSASAKRTTPSFDLSHKPSPDGFVHLLLSNFSEPGLFHVDVTDVSGTVTPQTTPYPVKWRGFAGEDRQIAKEALIDLAEVYAPTARQTDDSAVFISSSRRIRGAWESGLITLFSFSKQDGWNVEPRDNLFKRMADEIPDEFGFFFEEIDLVVRAIRLDSGEELTRTVIIGFYPPKFNEFTLKHAFSSETRVKVSAAPPQLRG